LLLGLYRVGDCVMHLCPICNRRTINVLDDDDDDDDTMMMMMMISVKANDAAEAASDVIKPMKQSISRSHRSQNNSSINAVCLHSCRVWSFYTNCNYITLPFSRR